MMRVILLVFLGVLVLAGCRKDVEVMPATAAGSVVICNDFLVPQYVSQDTVMMPVTDGVSSSSACFEYPCAIFSLRLRASSTHYYAFGQSILSRKVALVGNSQDSIGLLAQPPMHTTFNPRSFEVGDTLSPFQEVKEAAYLYFYDGMEGATSIYPGTWYLGFVKIIDGVKHVGYARIGTHNLPYGYFFEEVKLASCPGTSIVITE